MFNEIQIAKAEFQLQNTQHKNAHEVEGVTVQVPNILDRAALALSTILSRPTPNTRTRPCATVAVAK